MRSRSMKSQPNGLMQVNSPATNDQPKRAPNGGRVMNPSDPSVFDHDTTGAPALYMTGALPEFPGPTKTSCRAMTCTTMPATRSWKRPMARSGIRIASGRSGCVLTMLTALSTHRRIGRRPELSSFRIQYQNGSWNREKGSRKDEMTVDDQSILQEKKAKLVMLGRTCTE